MGSKCCDCSTVWKTKDGTLHFEASPIGDVTYFPPKSEVEADAEQRANFGQTVTVEGPFSNQRDWWTTIWIITDMKIVRELKEGPSSDSNCGCINANGGKAGFGDPKPENPNRIWTKTRTSNKYWWRVSLFSRPFGSSDDRVYTVPCEKQQEYEFTTRITWETIPWSKGHKCGKGCPGDSTISPPMFDVKDKVLKNCKDIAKNYKFN